MTINGGNGSTALGSSITISLGAGMATSLGSVANGEVTQEQRVCWVIYCVCVCVQPPVEGGYLLMRYQPQGEFTPPNACDVIPPPDSAHQPLPGEMLADGCPLGNVYGTATGLLVGVPPSASLCDT